MSNLSELDRLAGIKFGIVKNVDDFFIDRLKREIGSKKLLLSCWPFSNLKLSTFLQKCGIDYQILMSCWRKEGNYLGGPLYIYEDKPIITRQRTYWCEIFSPIRFQRKKDTSTNGSLFCSTHANLCFKMVWKQIPHQYYVGYDLIDAPAEEMSRKYFAFIIFILSLFFKYHILESGLLFLPFSISPISFSFLFLRTATFICSEECFNISI